MCIKSLGRNYSHFRILATQAKTLQLAISLETPKVPFIMPSRSNPNTPTPLKPKTARTLKSKRQNTQRLARNKITKPTPHTSQAIRRAAPLSRKKARKMDKKIGHAKQRAMEEAGEVEMKDIEEAKSRDKGSGRVVAEAEEAKMELDGVQ